MKNDMSTDATKNQMREIIRERDDLLAQRQAKLDDFKGVLANEYENAQTQHELADTEFKEYRDNLLRPFIEIAERHAREEDDPESVALTQTVQQCTVNMEDELNSQFADRQEKQKQREERYKMALGYMEVICREGIAATTEDLEMLLSFVDDRITFEELLSSPTFASIHDEDVMCFVDSDNDEGDSVEGDSETSEGDTDWTADNANGTMTESQAGAQGGDAQPTPWYRQ